MRQLIQRWLGGSRPDTWDLSGYPPSPLPHPGSGKTLSLAEAEENLDRFEATLASRQQALRRWLLAHDGPDPQALVGKDYALALNRWARQHWTKLPPFAQLPAHLPWPAVPRDGAFIVYSLLADLALTLGESVRQADSHWRWGLNLDPLDLADDMHSSRRIVLLAAQQQPAPESREVALDLEAMVVRGYEAPDAASFKHLDIWARTVGDAISGRDYSY